VGSSGKVGVEGTPDGQQSLAQMPSAAPSHSWPPPGSLPKLHYIGSEASPICTFHTIYYAKVPLVDQALVGLGERNGSF
jgi:hypothetical protein